MTNSLNTPVEALENQFPLRVRRYALRRGSGGAGLHRGGDGLIRELEFLAATDLSILSDRRSHAPWGLAGGGDARPGVNRARQAGVERTLPGKCELRLEAGDTVTLETPGGGGWGSDEELGENG